MGAFRSFKMYLPQEAKFKFISEALIELGGWIKFNYDNKMLGAVEDASVWDELGADAQDAWKEPRVAAVKYVVAEFPQLDKLCNLPDAIGVEDQCLNFRIVLIFNV